MFVVMCENTDTDPSVFAPFESEVEAQEWIESIGVDPLNNCPNDHYWLEAFTPVRNTRLAT